MKPTIGRIVHCRLAKYHADAINQRRKDAREKSAWHTALRAGYQAHVGNEVQAGEVYPAIVTRVWGDQPGSAFNAQLFLDGNDTFWLTSVQIGDKLGDCFWPQRDESPVKPAHPDDFGYTEAGYNEAVAKGK